MNQGVIYMCWGKKAIMQADGSIASLRRQAPDMPVFVVGDREAERHYNNRTPFSLVDVDPFRPDGQFMAGRIKPLLYELSPFKQSLYIDADSTFVASPDFAFKLLDRWDFILAETENRSLIDTIAGPGETTWTAEWLGTPHLLYHNSGMLFWRKNEAVKELFDLWSEEWLRFQNWDEQVALLRALLRSKAIYCHVPYIWNCRESNKAALVYHRFGTRAAWKFPRTRKPDREVRPQRGTVKPSSIPLVRVEVMPGRFVRCKPGDEEKIKARYDHLRRRKAQRRRDG